MFNPQNIKLFKNFSLVTLSFQLLKLLKAEKDPKQLFNINEAATTITKTFTFFIFQLIKLSINLVLPLLTLPNLSQKQLLLYLLILHHRSSLSYRMGSRLQ